MADPKPESPAVPLKSISDVFAKRPENEDDPYQEYLDLRDQYEEKEPWL